MNRHYRRMAWLLPLIATSLSACVTINIYFPAAAAEKAADKIIDDVWQIKDGKPAQQPSAGNPLPSQPAPSQPAQ